MELSFSDVFDPTFDQGVDLDNLPDCILEPIPLYTPSDTSSNDLHVPPEEMGAFLDEFFDHPHELPDISKQDVKAISFWSVLEDRKSSSIAKYLRAVQAGLPFQINYDVVKNRHPPEDLMLVYKDEIMDEFERFVDDFISAKLLRPLREKERDRKRRSSERKRKERDVVDL